LRITGEVITTPYSFVATAHSLLWNNIRAPRIISILQKLCGHKNAAKEADAQENIISTIDEFP
jgi:hypothetical protein